MELKGESRIAATRREVWTALNDPAVLARCIEGVESLTRMDGEDGATRFEGKMNAKVGPVRATFAGGVTVTEPDPPHRYVLVGEGRGGVAGFAKGQAEVVLTEDGDATLLTYAVTSSVGGKLAQLGSRLIEGTAKGYATTFFERFKNEVEGPAPVEPVDGAADTGMAEAAAAMSTAGVARTGGPSMLPVEASRGVSPLVWGALLIIAVLVLLAWQLS